MSKESTLNAVEEIFEKPKATKAKFAEYGATSIAAEEARRAALLANRDRLRALRLEAEAKKAR